MRNSTAGASRHSDAAMAFAYPVPINLLLFDSANFRVTSPFLDVDMTAIDQAHLRLYYLLRFCG